MKLISLVTLVLIVSACSSKEVKFKPEKTCSTTSLNYLKRNKSKPFLKSDEAIQAMQGTQKGVQACYESYAERSGKEEFDTCLVIAYDKRGKLDYWELSSQQVKLDPEFIKCANKTIGEVPFWKYGKNYILMQSYHFYKD